MQKKIQILPAAMIIIAVIAVIFRVFQLLVVVNYNEMGFFNPSAGFIPIYGLYLLLGAGAILFTIASTIDKRISSTAFTRHSASLTPGQTAVLGVAYLLGACLRLYELVFNFKGFSLSFVGEVLMFVLFTAIGFIILSSRKLKPVVGYLHIVICISCTLSAAALFMQDTIIVRVSDELLLLLSYVSSVLFFLALGRFISGNESKLTRHKLVIFGSLTAVLALCASLAGYIVLIIDRNHIVSHMTMHPLSETGSAIVAIAAVMAMYGRNAPEAEEPEEDPEDDESDDGFELRP